LQVFSLLRLAVENQLIPYVLMGKPRNVEDSGTLKLPYGRVFVIAGRNLKILQLLQMKPKQSEKSMNLLNFKKAGRITDV
jgi:hypothetical protein